MVAEIFGLRNPPFFFQCQEIHLSHNEVQQKGESLRFVFFLLLVNKNRNTLNKKRLKNTT